MGFIKMPYLPSIPYPNAEKPKLKQLEDLFRDWHQHFAKNSSLFPNHLMDEMVFDGFYPYYFSQKIKILFIGWESVDIHGCNYLDVLFECYRGKEKRIGDRHLNQSQFHYLMIYVTYGILNHMPAWQAIPFASKIGDTFGDSNGLSFAYMNISKLSNNVWQANHGIINTAYELSIQPRNFIQEEIAILESHVVITMSRTKKDKIASFGKLTPIDNSTHIDSYWLDSGANRSLLINTWHFSAHKPNIESFYNPICEVVRRELSALHFAV
jgi:hypothetical protein